ncbi:MAG: type II toxin-antitoxin system VapC family toxin [Candidatus Aminicenantes bacterium]|nr:MAG: type II toxin-antitoxin system VapC family toxin [Candidatus Aminicenantes bacterium]
MNGKYLLDTNIVILFLKKDNEIVEKIKELEEVYIPVTVFGELYFGAYKSQKVEENLKNISNLLENVTVLEHSVNTAKIYGEIKNQLKEKGKPIPENDIWIAAIAKQHDLTVITNDIHFEEIEDLKLHSI